MSGFAGDFWLVCNKKTPGITYRTTGTRDEVKRKLEDQSTKADVPRKKNWGFRGT